MAQPPVGLAFLGLGRWSRQLARAAERVPELRALTCYTRTAAQRDSFAAEFGCAASASVEAALAFPGVAAAIIAAPSEAHPSLTRACAERGIHVFVEKPIAHTLEEGLQMVRDCREHGVMLMVGHEMRRLGSSRAIRRVLEQGRLGNIVMATATMTLAGTFVPENWRTSRITNRGGALMQLGIHQIETLTYLLGPVSSARGLFRHVAAAADIDDVALADLVFESGSVASVASSYSSPSSYEIHLYGDRANLHCVADMRVWPDALRVDPATTLTIQSRDNVEAVAIEPQDVLALQFQEFAACIRNNREPETSGREGLMALAVVEAALRSFETERPVDPRTLILGE